MESGRGQWDFGRRPHFHRLRIPPLWQYQRLDRQRSRAGRVVARGAPRARTPAPTPPAALDAYRNSLTHATPLSLTIREVGYERLGHGAAVYPDGGGEAAGGGGGAGA